MYFLISYIIQNVAELPSVVSPVTGGRVTRHGPHHTTPHHPPIPQRAGNAPGTGQEQRNIFIIVDLRLIFKI